MDTAPPGTSVATFGDDYAIAFNPGICSIILHFSSFQDSLPIPFEVFDDAVVEGPEAFQLQSSCNLGGPVFTAPDEATVFSSAFVLILDNGSKCTCIILIIIFVRILCFREYVRIVIRTHSRHRWYRYTQPVRPCMDTSNCIGP